MATKQDLEQAKKQDYRSPLLALAGKAVDMVQGPTYGTYKDTCNDWYSNYSKPDHCG